MTMFSRTRSSSSRLSCWGTTPRWARTSGPCRPGSSPSTRSCPPVRSRVPPIIRIVVDFPAPLGPSRPKLSPACTSKSIPSTATTPPYSLRSPCALIAGSVTSQDATSVLRELLLHPERLGAVLGRPAGRLADHRRPRLADDGHQLVGVDPAGPEAGVPV